MIKAMIKVGIQFNFYIFPNCCFSISLHWNKVKINSRVITSLINLSLFSDHISILSADFALTGNQTWTIDSILEKIELLTNV